MLATVMPNAALKQQCKYNNAACLEPNWGGTSGLVGHRWSWDMHASWSPPRGDLIGGAPAGVGHLVEFGVATCKRGASSKMRDQGVGVVAALLASIEF